MTALVLALAGVRRRFGGVRAVDGVDLTLERGEILGLIGPNGAGKTTLLNLVTGLVRPDAGSIGLIVNVSGGGDECVELADRRVHTIAALGVARTFQNLRLYRDLTAVDNVIVGMHAHRRSDILSSFVPMPYGRRLRAERIEGARRLLATVGLDPDVQGGRAAGTLSYGDQRRLEIARALALQPQVLLLDEPAAGMNPVEKDRLRDVLRGLVTDSSLTVVLIEHDLRLVMGLCSRVAVMDFGRKIADGPPAVVAEDPAVVAAYLGRRASEGRRLGHGRGARASLLEVDGLHVSYGSVDAVQEVSLRVAEGEVVTLIGANGAGKTTILRTLSGLIPARKGTARLADVDLLASTPSRIVAAGLVHVPEGREILGALTVEENLQLGGWPRSDKKAVAREIEDYLQRFPVLGERRELAAGQLSGGEQQILAVVRALLAKPRLLLLDEPSLGLAPQLADSVFDVIASLAEGGMTILLVEQNAARALELADRGYVLESGRISLSGPAEDLRNDPRVQAAYLGT